MILLTLIGIRSYYVGKISASSDDKNIINKYTNILISIREDALQAAKANIKENNLYLVDRTEKLIAHYKLENGNFTKDIGRNDVEPILMLTEVNEVKFWLNAEYPNLLSMKLTTKNPDNIPFVTSFALRCYKNE